ncbi:2-succinyl-6-hydroxy-2,4-cyclohexadiene-1-carboxylate synthase [Enterococcus sp. LJL99]
MNYSVNGVDYYCEWLLPYHKEYPTLVCLHGFTGSSQTFHSLFTTRNHWNILGIDLLGHGKTASFVHPYRYRLESLCQDLAEVTARLGLSKFALLGYSMGARVALGFTVFFPEKVTHLILESGSPGLKGSKERELRKRSDQQIAQSIVTQPIEQFVDYWENLALFETQKSLSKSTQLRVRQERLQQDQWGLACSLLFMGTGTQPSFWEELECLNKIPILLIVGTLDYKFQQIACQMKKVQTNISISSIQGAGHCVHLEQPKIFQNEVLHFLQGDD